MDTVGEEKLSDTLPEARLTFIGPAASDGEGPPAPSRLFTVNDDTHGVPDSKYWSFVRTVHEYVVPF